MKGKQLAFDFSEMYRTYPSEESQMERRLSSYLKGSKVNITYTDNSSTMISFRNDGNGVLIIRLHHMFRAASPEILKALAQYLTKHTDASRLKLDQFFEKNKLLIKRKSPKKMVFTIKTKGNEFNLEELFNKLNAEYFNSELKVRVSWGKKSKGTYNIRLGSYNLEDNLIRIHPALDSEKVPRYFIESVIFHEMCHAAIGIVNSRNGKNRFHTKEFKEWEKKYKHYDKAALWEQKNIQKLFKK